MPYRVPEAGERRGRAAGDSVDSRLLVHEVFVVRLQLARFLDAALRVGITAGLCVADGQDPERAIVLGVYLERLERQGNGFAVALRSLVRLVRPAIGVAEVPLEQRALGPQIDGFGKLRDRIRIAAKEEVRHAEV